MTRAEEIVLEAWHKFAIWCREHDPDGEMGRLEAIDAYHKAMSTPPVSSDTQGGQG